MKAAPQMKLPRKKLNPEAQRQLNEKGPPVDPAVADDYVGRATQQEAAAIPKPIQAPPPEQTKRLTLDLPVSLHRKFKKKAIDNDMTMMQFLIKAVEQWTREN